MNVSKSEFQEVALAINDRKKDAVLNIRINHVVLYYDWDEYCGVRF